ncbi:SPOR domain-containing protein [Hymenobacter aerilatus]|uniref:SPOR domain-containing protein n=1 Tax=Hymenobacter aerilatus TaxID=2932251 RepID=A0A8T9SYI7_9BACT|nr:SPOR domain-containing protein [Hymenobacter aerilatus]UOR06925.1 SPOR domain-containing protein [Hymenobacter aerilatus]
MQLSNHIHTLLQHHDCVIIPEFGGLIAEYAPAQIHPVRHTLAPPTKRVAFNQSLTRNDGLLVDALSRALGVSTGQARQLVQEAVARLRAELETQQRAELPGIGVFRQAAGRGLDFEYTGSQSLLSASYGLPELVSRPVRATDALLARERQPAVPQLAAGRRARRLWQSAAVAVVVGLALSAQYLYILNLDFLPDALRFTSSVPAQTELSAPTAVRPMRQQATLSPRPDNNEATWSTTVADAPVETPATVTAEDEATAAAWEKEATAPAPAPAVATPAAKKVAPVATTPAAPAKPAVAATKPAAVVPAKAVAPAATPAAATETTIKSRTGRFYIIADVFNSLPKAQQRVAQLSKQGQTAQIILPSATSRYYRVSVGNYTDKSTATAHLTQLKKYSSSSPWVLPY